MGPFPAIGGVWAGSGRCSKKGSVSTRAKLIVTSNINDAPKYKTAAFRYLGEVRRNKIARKSALARVLTEPSLRLSMAEVSPLSGFLPRWR
jgi:hypothetical protein